MSIMELVKEIAAGVLNNSDQPALQIGVMSASAQVKLEGQSGARPCLVVKHPLEYLPQAGDKVAVLRHGQTCIVLGKV